MCGICGFMSRQNISKASLQKMNKLLEHRGPDDHGEEIFHDGEYVVGLAQCRLAIMDLSDLGHQPMSSLDGRFTIVFNGEVYNFRDLRKKLSKYYDFKSECDTEVILASYSVWGKKCVNYLNGMFAFCIYDRKYGQLFLARDRVGKKPLYYWLDKESHTFVFASELKSIMCFPTFHDEMDVSIVPVFLYHQYINAPNTIYKNVKKLEQGKYLVFGKQKIEKGKYWDIIDVYNKGIQNILSDYQEAKYELMNCLAESVKKRLVADVPVGIFLSGGYDSSLIAALAQREAGKNKLKSFSVGFTEDDIDESVYAKKIAGYLGTDHVELICTESDLLNLIDDLPFYFDEPFADPSLIPTMAVAKLAKNDVKVVLSGDGGDEFFCGYTYYDQIRAAQLLYPFGKVLHHIGKVTGTEDKFPFRVKVISQNTEKLYQTQIRSRSYEDCVNEMVLTDAPVTVKYDELKYINVSNWQVRRMLLDIDSYLANGILAKVDRATMKYALECRCPILDMNVMELSFRMMHKFRYDRGIKKRILKDITHSFIPEKLINRPKMGFNIPLDKWLRGGLKERILSFSEESYLRRQGIFNPVFCSRVIHDYLKNGNHGVNTGENYQNICWNFYIFQEWYYRWKEGVNYRV